MGVTEWLLRQASRRTTVLVAEMPGGWRAKVRAESCVVNRGWRLAESPAGADLLVVCAPVPSELEASIDAVWEQLPGPRARAEVLSDVSREAVDAALDDALARLSDTAAQRQEASTRTSPPEMEHGDMDHGEMGHGDMGHGEMGHGEMGHGGMGHGEMGHGDMDMAPDGIPLATGADDRDGLEMDELHLRLGPVLTHWPAGLEMTWTLHGDLVAEAEARWLPSAAEEFEPHASDHPARAADALTDLLRLAGWDDAADRAMHLRNRALPASDERGDEVPTASLGRGAVELARRVGRSRTVRWSLRGLGRVERSWVEDRGLPRWWVGDAHDRLLVVLDAVRATSSPPTPSSGGSSDPEPPRAEHLAELCTGLDVAAARLVVASLALGVGALQDDQEHADA